MWTAKNRPRYNRDKLRYPSDLTEEEWALVEPHIPPGKRGGGKRRVNMREVVNGVMYILSTGCQWRSLPKDLPPRSTVHDYLSLWQWDGTLDRIHHELYLKCRDQAECEANPTACVIDSQSVKSAEKGGLVSIRPALTRASRSKAGSGTSSSIPKACFYAASSPLPMFRTAMAALLCWRRSLACSPFSKGYSPIAPMKGRSLRLRWRAFCLG